MSQGESSGKKQKIGILDTNSEAKVEKEKEGYKIQMREKKIESDKGKMTLKENKKDKSSSLVRKHSPMKLDALFNGIVEQEMLEQIVALYAIVDDVAKETIEEVVVKYIVTFELNMKNIEK